MDKLALAIKDYDKAIEIDPADKNAVNNRGAVLGRLGRYSEAIRDFERAIEIDPALASAHKNLGKVYEIRGETDKAILSYKKAAALGSLWAKEYLSSRGLE